jgi:hypothetical protein
LGITIAKKSLDQGWNSGDFIPQGTKARPLFCGICGTTEQPAEKLIATKFPKAL